MCPEIDAHTYSQLIFNKDATKIQQEKNYFHEVALEKLGIYMREKNDPCLIISHHIQKLT